MTKTNRPGTGFCLAIVAASLAISVPFISRASAQEAVSQPGAPAAPGVTTASPAPGSAQAAPGSATAERIIVTGSNIPTAEEVGPNPVVNLNRDTITKSGERNTEELLRNLPIANANGVPVSNNENGSNTAVGGATIALRGFDPRATLILIDGR